MSAKTNIEWTEITWNPVRGCSLVSDGCRNCYAMKQAHRMSGPGSAYEGLTRLGAHGPVWNGKVRVVRELLAQPLRWRKPRRVLVNSMSDLFHPEVPDGFIMDVWRIMGNAWPHTFQILTKRPERMCSWLATWADTREDDYEPKLARGPDATRAAHKSGRAHLFADMLEGWGDPPPGCCYPTYDWLEGMCTWPTVLPKVWLGVSVEDQKAAEQRIPLLLQTPAVVRFVSAEPLLGPLDLGPYLEKQTIRPCNPCGWGRGHAAGCAMASIDWLVVGGESGQRARPMHPDWARSLRDQCQRAGVPFFFKQWGRWCPTNDRDSNWAKHAVSLTGAIIELADFDPIDRGHPGWVRMHRRDKKWAGRELDGRKWDDFPVRTRIGSP